MDADRVLPPRMRAIVDALARTIVGVPDAAPVADRVEPLARRLPAADRRQLRWLLRAIEYGALAFGGFRRFTRLQPEARAAYLRRWMNSRNPLLRQGASALKTLVVMAYYGGEAAWDDVGYDGPWLGRVDVPVLPAPSIRADAGGPERPGTRPGVSLARHATGDVRLRAEVCVIGTGAGGAAALARLAARGVDVVAVEAGGHPTAEDYTQRELEMLPLLYQEAGLRATSNKAIGILQGRGAGGSTLHNTGLVVPPPDAILDRWRREHGLPFDPTSMQRYVSDTLDTLRARPIPAKRVNRNNDALRRGAERLGWSYRIPRHNRAECCECGYCMLGCAYNRKYGAGLTYLPRAVRDGARVLCDAPVAEIEGRAGARRVVCRLQDGAGRPTGHRAVIEASRVILAAGALDSPALLQRSGLGPRGVGRSLRLHPAALVAGVFPEPIRAWRGLPQSVILDEFASFYDDGRGGFLVIPTAAWPGMTAALAPGLGDRHRAFMRSYPNVASAAVLLHDETAGRVRAGRDGRPRASYWPDRTDRESIRDGVRALATAYLAAGAEQVRLPYGDASGVRNERELERALERARSRPHRLALNSVHPQGSCPLGDRASRSAVGPYGEVWGEPGVYVCDTSIFPTSVGVPPQVTTMALAAAIADHIASELP